MDSGNSCSMQSSSGDDEEHDSRTGSVPVVFNANPLSNPHPSLVSHQQNQPHTFFDPSANDFNPFSQAQPNNSLLNFDGVMSLGQRSEPDSIVEFANLHGSSSSVQPRPSLKYDQKSVVKNPKKRRRASRTAPTTVLTTDTMNFRAIVQEFTGIPAPPFSGSSYSRRLDLFGSGSGMQSSHLGTLGSLYPPLRPLAKRVKPMTPVVSSSPLADDVNITNITTSNYTCSNYAQQPQIMLNLQNQSPILSFQSLLHPSPQHSCLALPGFAVSSYGSSAMPSIDELGLSHGNATTNGANNGNGDHLRPLDWNYDGSTDENSQRVHGCKLNHTASSSSFQNDKELENVSSSAEGRVDPWIFPAD